MREPDIAVDCIRPERQWVMRIPIMDVPAQLRSSAPSLHQAVIVFGLWAPAEMVMSGGLVT